MFYSKAAGFTPVKTAGGQVEIDDDYWLELVAGLSSGKVIMMDKNSQPVLADPPPLTADQQQQIAEEERSRLMAVASKAIEPLQYAEKWQLATAGETALLESWQKYMVQLNRVDTSTAPEIDWPSTPEA